MRDAAGFNDESGIGMENVNSLTPYVPPFPIIDMSGPGLLERKSLDSDDFQLLSEFGHQSEKKADKTIKLAVFAITFL